VHERVPTVPSILELFRIGIGPSSSHTVGPMRAARAFLLALRAAGDLGRVERVEVELYGALALTGPGHGTDRAILLGLAGDQPDAVDPDTVAPRLEQWRSSRRLPLLGERPIVFDPTTDLRLRGEIWLPDHPNALRCRAFDRAGTEVLGRTYFSVGGGVVVDERGERIDEVSGWGPDGGPPVPFPFETADGLLAVGRETGLAIPDIVLANEDRRETGVLEGLDRIWSVMAASIDRGLRTEGVLPGGLGVARRAPILWRSLERGDATALSDPLDVMERVNVYAMAVNEENAAGGRVVTAPTNGAAGLLPAVARYYERHAPGSGGDGLQRLFLTAGAIGLLYRTNASISGAEVGCQGEVGVAASMAAGGLAAALGGTNEQIENAAEIAMEHHLGMTCDPIGGLVQIPCIERNALGAVKAINAARMALRGDGSHKVSLDQVIRTMDQTGRDMGSRYKETAQGGLAVNVPDC
jgi:L-serine dehydratase